MSVSGESVKAKFKSSFMSKGKVRKMIPYRYQCRSIVWGCFMGISGSDCLAAGLSLGGVSSPNAEPSHVLPHGRGCSRKERGREEQ